MRKFKQTLILSALLVLGMSACSSEGTNDTADPIGEVQEGTVTEPNESGETLDSTDETNETNEEASNEKKSNSPENNKESKRPETKLDTINLEGFEEEFAFQLYEASALGFSTYIIEDMLADTVSSEEGDVFIAKANFGGTVTEEARISIFSPNELNIQSLEELSQLSKEISEINGFTISESNNDSKNHFDWSNEEYDIKKEKNNGEWLIGTVSLFSHGDRFYMLTIQYPEEYSEGFYPRVVRLVNEIVWIE